MEREKRRERERRGERGRRGGDGRAKRWPRKEDRERELNNMSSI